MIVLCLIFMNNLINCVISQLQKHKDDDLSSLLKVTLLISFNLDGNIALLRCLVLCGALNAVYTNSPTLILCVIHFGFIYKYCTIFYSTILAYLDPY